ncbi:FAD-dependent thymidylate synthase [Pseudothermotoga thermarum]|uniref:Flavin-dependent thymidylate synthase n=1 Tax=Pseudothermotoga thermarum DSM 5069 TaxID=688269 RepID=F7YU58_9THEM|nr:FAD-dependent thymidylate synthase [Pseudothermotoga thermarum]AEH50154.1 thymidylate synthase (FAD) [Pseudothermotoga thermarum DSM 5069]
MTIQVLDKGFVKLIDHLGNDLTAVRAARISFGKDVMDEERDKRLIEHLLKNGHESPFEHIVFTFHIKCPIFVARQWMRHRIASYNELSGRYTQFGEEFYIPKADDPRLKLSDQQNGEICRIFEDAFNQAYDVYRKLLDLKVPRELARIVLPLSLYTEFIWSVNARSLFNFLSLRADSHAQFEMQQYAKAVATIFKQICPWTYEAFIKHRYTGDLLKEGEV